MVEYFESEGLLFAYRDDRFGWVWRDHDWEPVDPGSHLDGLLQQATSEGSAALLDGPPPAVPEPPEDGSGRVIPLVRSEWLASRLGDAPTVVYLVLSEDPAEPMRTIRFEGAFLVATDADRLAEHVEGEVHRREVALRAVGPRIEILTSDREPFDVWTLREIVGFLERAPGGSD